MLLFDHLHIHVLLLFRLFNENYQLMNWVNTVLTYIIYNKIGRKLVIN